MSYCSQRIPYDEDDLTDVSYPSQLIPDDEDDLRSYSLDTYIIQIIQTIR